MTTGSPLTEHLLTDAVFGPPRRILLLLAWDVGDDTPAQWRCATIISSALAAATIAIYMLAAFACCERSNRKAARKAKKVLETAGGISLDEVWTVHNKRYDLRAFAAAHPGGAGALKLGQGRNCTELYESYHSLANEKLVAATLQRYFLEDAPVGAPDYAAHFEWAETPFFSTLKGRVRAHFRATGRSHQATNVQWTQLLLFITASGLALWSFMCGELAGLLALPFCYWWGPSPCMHDGGHFSLCTRPWVNAFFAHIGGAHMSLFSWQHQHTIGHHVHTNIAGCDPDLYHFELGADAGVPGFRTSLQARTLPEKTTFGLSRDRWWRLGVCLRAPFTTFGPSILWDMMSLVVPDFEASFLGVVPYRQGHTGWELGGHSAGRAIIIWLAIIHPITVSLVTASSWLTGGLAALLFIVLPYGLHGCLFYMFSQVSHIQEECFHEAMPEGDLAAAHLHHHPSDKHHRHRQVSNELRKAKIPGMATAEELAAASAATGYGGGSDGDESAAGNGVTLRRRKAAGGGGDPPAAAAAAGGERGEWAVHQLEHALDYSVDSTLWTHLSNGLNMQVVHHLFPQVGWGHYAAISPLIAQTAAEFGLTYTVKPTFWSAMSGHFRYLASINDTAEKGAVWLRPARTADGRLGFAGKGALHLLDQIDELFSWEHERATGTACTHKHDDLLARPAASAAE